VEPPEHGPLVTYFFRARGGRAPLLPRIGKCRTAVTPRGSGSPLIQDFADGTRLAPVERGIEGMAMTALLTDHMAWVPGVARRRSIRGGVESFGGGAWRERAGRRSDAFLPCAAGIALMGGTWTGLGYVLGAAIVNDSALPRWAGGAPRGRPDRDDWGEIA
jgi:hypothetical protein